MSPATDDRWERVSELFDVAFDLPPDERPAYLVSACGDDLELRREVEEMLAGLDREDGILERSLVDLDPELTTRESDAAMLGGLAPGLKMGHYELIREIGRGGMSVVFKARDTRLERDVALKFLAHHRLEDDTSKIRFAREARAASGLDHPNLCTVFDIGDTDDGSLFIAMAYYPGRTLDRQIACGPLPVASALRIADELAAGLDHAHRAGIVHRDIKPSNIILTESGVAKILDFGVAKLQGGSKVTQSGTAIGTIAYMAPEQARGEAVDARTDLWALGIVLYEMLAGRPPFARPFPALMLHAIFEEQPVAISSLRAEVPAEIDALLGRLMAKRAEERYPNAAELRADLDILRSRLGEEPTLPRPSAATMATATDSRAATVSLTAALSANAETVRLPAALTSFVGREREGTKLRRMLAETRLVTITGPAGTGKTRLALEVARSLASEFAGGVLFVPLAAVEDPRMVGLAIAEALGMAETLSLPVENRVVDHLRPRQLLLVLDNFEQVVEAAPLIGSLLSRCPKLKVLVTSRLSLHVTGEHELNLPPLAVPRLARHTPARDVERSPAVALFVERARAVCPGFSLTDTNVRAVAELVVKLDGLPLAIELAASRSKLLSPRAMLDRLGERLDLLSGGLRDMPTRHRTLRQAIAWSYDLLSPDQQLLFRWLSPFVGGMTLEMAEAAGVPLGLGELLLLEALEILVDQSLLQREACGEGEPRLAMLETLRTFGLERLADEGESDAARQRHAEILAELATTAEPHLTGSEQQTWLDRLAEEHDNLRAAIAWSISARKGSLALRLATSLWRFWLVRGQLEEGRAALEKALALPDDTIPSQTRAQALFGLATLCHNQGENRHSRALLEESLELWLAAGDILGEALARVNLGWVACEISELDTAEEISGHALTLHRQLGDRRGAALALNNLGWVACYRGRPAEAAHHHRASLALRQELGDRRGSAFAHSNLAWAEQLAGRYRESEDHLSEALDLLADLDDRVHLGWALLLRAQGAILQGDIEAARDDLDESMPLWRDVGNRSGQAWALTLQGWTTAERHDPGFALTQYGVALALWRGIECRWGIAWTQSLVARLGLSLGDPDQALEPLRESLVLRRQLDDQVGLAESLELLALLDETLAPPTTVWGPPTTAVTRLAAADHLRRHHGLLLPPVYHPLLDRRRGQLLETLGQESFDQAWEPGSETGPDGLGGLLAAP